jgi:hypothetical protein
MEKIDFTGVSPEISEYISSLEKTIEDQSKRIDNLTEMLSKRLPFYPRVRPIFERLPLSEVRN